MTREARSAPLPLALGILGVGAASAALGALALSSAWFGRKRRQPLTLAAWEASLDAQGRLYSSHHLFARIALQGIEPGVRRHVWPFLLGVHGPDSTAKQRAAAYAEAEEAYRDLLTKAQAQVSVGAQPSQGDGSNSRSRLRDGPNGAGSSGVGDGNGSSIPDSGVEAAEEVLRCIMMDVLRTPVLPPVPAPPDWQHPDSLRQQSSRRKTSSGPMRSEADVDGERCVTATAEETLQKAVHPPAARLHAARLFNLLAAHEALDPELGYAQGMSDLAAPFLQVFEGDTVLAFWCFAGMMRGLRDSFSASEVGIRRRLGHLAHLLAKVDAELMHRLEHLQAADCLFAYRMVVVQLLRELPAWQAMSLWEMSWAGQCGMNGPPAFTTSPLASPEATSAPVSPTCKQDSADRPNVGQEDGSPTLLQCFVAAVVCSQRRAILEDCDGADAVFCLFGTQQVAFEPVVEQAQALRRRLTPGYEPHQSFDDFLSQPFCP